MYSHAHFILCHWFEWVDITNKQIKISWSALKAHLQSEILSKWWKFYTSAACDACDKYHVWTLLVIQVLSLIISCSLIHTVLIIGVWCLTDIEFSSFWYCILKDCLFTFRITGCWVGVMRCGGNHLEVANGPQVTISDANSESWCSGLGPTSKKQTVHFDRHRISI